MPTHTQPKKKKFKSTSPLRRRIRRRIRKYIGPKQTEEMGLRPAFKDGLIFHSQVRVGKRGPKTETFQKGKPKAIVVTKFRTMKKGSYADERTMERKGKNNLTSLGKCLRKRHHDELPQIISVLKGDLAGIGLRVQRRQHYRKLSPELRAIYDSFGPGYKGLEHAVGKKNPTQEEILAVAEEFYDMLEKDPKRAYKVFGKRISRKFRGEETAQESPK